MLKVNVKERVNFTDQQITKHVIACELLEKAINSDEFKTRLMGQHLIQTKNMNNLEIYSLIMSGKEYGSGADGGMDIYVEIYTDRKSGVIGYTYPNDKWAYLNSYFFDQFSYAEIACNATHEWLHKVGFEHDFYNTTLRPFSVPYCVGYLIMDLVNKLDDNPGTISAQPNVVCKRDWKTLWLKKKCYHFV